MNNKTKRKTTMKCIYITYVENRVFNIHNIYWDGTYIRYIYILTICKSIKQKKNKRKKHKNYPVYTQQIYIHILRNIMLQNIFRNKTKNYKKQKQVKNHHKNGNIFIIFGQKTKKTLHIMTKCNSQHRKTVNFYNKT